MKKVTEYSSFNDTAAVKKVILWLTCLAMPVAFVVFVYDLNSFVKDGDYLIARNIEFLSNVIAVFSSLFLLLSVAIRRVGDISLETGIYASGANRYQALGYIFDTNRARIGIGTLVFAFLLSSLKNTLDSPSSVDTWWQGTTVVVLTCFVVFCLLWLRVVRTSRKDFLSHFKNDLLSNEFKEIVWKRSDSELIWLERLGEHVLGIKRLQGQSAAQYYEKLRVSIESSGL